MYRTIAAILAASACVSSLQAQLPNLASNPTSLVITLDDALDAALANSPALDASRSGIRAAEAQRSVAGLRPNPTLDAMAENVGGSGDYRGFRSTETTVGLSMPLELGGKRSARVAVAEAQLGRAGLDAVIALADLRQRVTQAYNEAVANQRRSTNAREQVGIAAEGLRVARVRVVSGRASPLEEQRADVARLTAEGTAERAERSAEVALANLARLTGRPAVQLDTLWFGRIENMGPLRPVETGGTLAAVAAQADFTTASAQVRLARSQRVPDVTVIACSASSSASRRFASACWRCAEARSTAARPLLKKGIGTDTLKTAAVSLVVASRRAAALARTSLHPSAR